MARVQVSQGKFMTPNIVRRCWRIVSFSDLTQIIEEKTMAGRSVGLKRG